MKIFSLNHSASVIRPETASLIGVNSHERQLWPDVARGFAIILVVLGHAIGGLISSGQIAQGSFLQQTYSFIYSFHMALFFFLSGMFIKRRVRDEPRRLFKDSIIYIAYPYILWGIFQMIVITQLGGAVNTPYKLKWTFLISVLWSPPSQFWFLYVLLVYQMAALVLLPRVNPAWIVIGGFTLSIAAELIGLTSVLATISRFLPYYALGILAGPRLLEGLRLWSFRPAIAVAATILWFAFSALSIWVDPHFYFAAPAAVLGSLAVVIASSLVDGSTAQLLAALGRKSMPVFLLHVLFVAGVRIVFKLALGVTETAVVLPFAVVLGIFGPLTVVAVAQHYGIASRLGLAKDPKQRRRIADTLTLAEEATSRSGAFAPQSARPTE